MPRTPRFEADSPVFVPRRERARTRVQAHFWLDGDVWDQVKAAAKEAGMSHGEFAEQAFRYALQNLGD